MGTLEDATTIEGLEARLAEMEQELAALRAQVAEPEPSKGRQQTGERTSVRRKERTGLWTVAATVVAAALVATGVGATLSGFPLALDGVHVIVGSMALAVAGFLTTRYFLKIRFSEGQNDITGFLFTTVGVLYAVVLAFVVFAAWEQFASAERSVTDEAAALVLVFRDTQEFPQPYRAEAQTALRAYAHEVMAVEWASHGTLGLHRTPDPLNAVWAVYRRVQQTRAVGPVQYADILTQLHALELQRHLRHLASEASLPNIFWWLLVIGGVGTVCFAYFFQMENVRVQAGLIALLAGALASILFLTLTLDHPFTGQVHVSQNPLKHALLQFDALNRNPLP